MSSETFLIVYEQVPVVEAVYELGYPGFLIYVVFVVMVLPQVVVEMIQQTPNPAAQFPSAVPDFEVHSELVKHVPMVVDELVDVHSSLGNCTTEKRDNSFLFLSSVIFLVADA